MNFLNIRKGPKMEFIVGEHRNEFEKTVIDTYCEVQGGFWGAVPSLERDILNELNPKFTFAGLLGQIHDDPSHYAKETHGKLLPEFEPIWCAANLKNIGEAYPGELFKAMQDTAYDIVSVLDYHNMFYAVKVGEGPGTGQQAFCNFPIVEVW